MVNTQYKPGQEVPESGIYKVLYDETHAKEHEVTVIEGRKFPSCRGVLHPRFELVRAAIHIDDHHNF